MPNNVEIRKKAIKTKNTSVTTRMRRARGEKGQKGDAERQVGSSRDSEGENNWVEENSGVWKGGRR